MKEINWLNGQDLRKSFELKSLVLKQRQEVIGNHVVDYFYQKSS